MTCRNNGTPQELDDCDVNVEFAHFLSNVTTLERKKKEKQNPVSCYHLAQIYPLFRELYSYKPRGFSPGTPVFSSPQKPTFDLTCIKLIDFICARPHKLSRFKHYRVKIKFYYYSILVRKHARSLDDRRSLNSMSLSILRFACAVKSTIEKLNVAKISQNVFR